LGDRKEFLLRIDQKLHDELRRWADDDLRSLNAQVEWILRRAIDQRRRETTDKDKKTDKKQG
jgi:hypothetical protein